MSTTATRERMLEGMAAEHMLTLEQAAAKYDVPLARLRAAQEAGEFASATMAAQDGSWTVVGVLPQHVAPWAKVEHRSRHAGHAVRVMREALGLTLEQLAQAGQTSPSYLSQVERGDRSPSRRWMRLVQEAIVAEMSRRRAGTK